MPVAGDIILFANDAANVDNTEQPLVEPGCSHGNSHILAKWYVVALCVRTQCKVKQALKLHKRCGLRSLAQFCMGEVEEMGEVG